jgi:hypothetical protein
LLKEVKENGEYYITGSFFIHSFTKYYSSDETKNNEMGGECSRYWRQERCIADLVGKPEGTTLKT